MSNGCVSGNRDYPMNVGEAHRQMKFYKQNLSQMRESDGTQHHQIEEEQGVVLTESNTL